MNPNFQITNDDNNGKRKSRIVMPGTPEYEAGLRNIIKPNKKGKTDSLPPIPPTLPRVVTSGSFTIDDLISNGRVFYNPDTNRGVALALEEALNLMGNDGRVASMPYLIAGKSKANKKSYLWKDWFTTFSEEDIGIDKQGRYVQAGKPVVLTVHGGGILCPNRIVQAYNEGLTDQRAAKLTESEFDQLLEGTLPNGESIPVYSIDYVKNGNIQDLFGRFAVWYDFEKAKATISGYHSKTEFMKNELVLARAGTLEYLSKYFDKAKDPSDNTLGNHHRLNEIDPSQPQGRLLFLNFSCGGLSGNDDLFSSGRFVGVAPEAQVKK